MNATHSPHTALSDKVNGIFTSARSELGDLDQQTRNFARERPVIAVISALALGYLIARLSARI